MVLKLGRQKLSLCLSDEASADQRGGFKFFRWHHFALTPFLSNRFICCNLLGILKMFL